VTSRLTRAIAAAALSLGLAMPAVAATPATEAPVDEGYTALLGVQAEALSEADMDAIHGALTGQDLFDRILASAQLIKDPALRQKVIDSLLANQTTLVAYFDRLLKWRR